MTADAADHHPEPEPEEHQMTEADLSHLSPNARNLITRTETLVARYPDSEVTDIPEDGDYDFRLTKQSLLQAQVCTRKTGQEAADWLTEVRPPGTTNNRWYLTEDVDPVMCQQFPDTHTHYIVEC